MEFLHGSFFTSQDEIIFRYMFQMRSYIICILHHIILTVIRLMQIGVADIEYAPER
jgi:uncharacterized membrane protein